MLPMGNDLFIQSLWSSEWSNLRGEELLITGCHISAFHFWVAHYTGMCCGKENKQYCFILDTCLIYRLMDFIYRLSLMLWTNTANTVPCSNVYVNAAWQCQWTLSILLMQDILVYNRFTGDHWFYFPTFSCLILHDHTCISAWLVGF